MEADKLGAAPVATRLGLWKMLQESPPPVLHQGTKQGGFNSAAYSPTGRLVVFAGANSDGGFVLIADGKLGTTVRTLKLPSTVLCLAREGNTILLGCQDGGVRRLQFLGGDTRLELERKPIASFADGVIALAATPEWLLAGHMKKGAILLHRQSGKKRRIPKTKGQSIPAVTLSPDGRLALVGRTPTVELYALPSLEIRKTLSVPSGSHRVALSPNLDMAAVGCTDGRVLVWDLLSGHLLRSWRAPSRQVLEVGFSPDGFALMAMSRTGIRLWNVRSNSTSVTLVPPGSRGLAAVGLSPDGWWAAAGNHHGDWMTWHLPSWRMQEALGSKLAGPFHEVVATRDSIFASSMAGVFQWQTRQPLDRLSNRPIKGRISRLAASPTGLWLAATGHEGSLRVWRMNVARRRLDLKFPSPVQCLALKPNGRLVLLGTRDGHVRLIDLESKKARSITAPRTKPLLGTAFLPRDRVVLIDAAGAWVHDADGRPTSAVKPAPFSCHAVAPRRQRILFGGLGADGRQLLTLWDLERSTRTLALQTGSRLPLTHVALAPDGRSAAAASEDGSVELWDLESKKRLLRFTRSRTVNDLAITLEGDLLVAGEALWRVRVGSTPGRFRARLKPQLRVAMSRDERLAFTNGQHGPARLWDLLTMKELWVLPPASRGVAADLHPTKPLAITSQLQHIRVWDLQNRALLHTWRGEGDFYTLAFRAGREEIISGDRDGRVQVWSLRGELRQTLLHHTGAVRDLALLPDGRSLLSSSEDGMVVVSDLSTGALVRKLPHRSVVYGVAATPDGRRAVTASRDRLVRVWDIASGQELARMRGHGEQVTAVDVSRDGRLAVTGGRDRVVRLWDLERYQEVRGLRGHTGLVYGVALGRRRAVSTGYDGLLRVWEFEKVDRWKRVRTRVHPAMARWAKLRKPNAAPGPKDPAILDDLAEWLQLQELPGLAVEIMEKAHAIDAAKRLSPLRLARLYWLVNDPRAPEWFERALSRKSAPAPYLRLCLESVTKGP